MADCIPFTESSSIVNSYRDSSKSLAVSEVNSLIDFKYDRFAIDRRVQNTEVYSFFLLNVPCGKIKLTYSDAGLTTLISGEKL